MPEAASLGFSAFPLSRAWYIACASSALRTRPLAVTVCDTPMVLFRDESGAPHCLLDRCPHRNVPLSLGRVKETGTLECAYHGWSFAGDGRCTNIPALCRPPGDRRVSAYPVREQQGYVWVYAEAIDADEEAVGAPFFVPGLDQPGYAVVRHEAVVAASVHATAENILDVPHTAYLHKTLFRGQTTNDITAKVERSEDRVVAEYRGEPVPTGLIGKMLAPQGGVLEHHDRFFLPSVAQVEYRLGEKSHIVVTSMLTPESAFRTRLFAVASFRIPLPTFLVRAVGVPVGAWVLRQDLRMLSAQSETLRRFEEERYSSSDVDLLGPHIAWLLRRATAGSATPFEPYVREVQIRA